MAGQKTIFHARDNDAVIAQLKTNAEKGLSSQEVAHRLEQHGKNIIADKKQKGNLKILLEQFANPIIWILILATVLAFAYGHTLEGYAVLIVILVNTFIGFFMERQAMRSMEKLRSMARSKALVMRNGEKNVIDSVDIVPGDILFIKSGDVVTADGRVIVQNNLALKEAALTGESAHVEKSVDPVAEDTRVADQRNMIFKGTIVSRGNGVAVVVGTGANTELGKITELAQEAKKELTPLNKKLKSLSKKLIWLTLFLAALIFVSGIARGEDWLLMVETAIALAIASIPEGLPVISTLSLARGMLALARKNVIVKTLEAVQTLGETEVIFTDKTGTLTENEMHVHAVVFDGIRKDFSDASNSLENLKAHEAYKMFIKVALLCNNGSFEAGNGKPTSSGDPEEVALLRLAGKLAEDTKALQHRYERVAELPFDAQLKMMATVNRSDEEYMICVKGAAEEVLQQCTQIMEGGAINNLTDHDRWKTTANEMADEGLRVLGFAYRMVQKKPGKENFIHDLTFIGLAGFIDPARPDVRQAILDCRKAGIKVVMVTGDHPGTANAIAREVGLAGDEEIINVHGKELQENSSEEQIGRVLKATVFSRVDPAQKLNLVTIYQKKKIIIGMTGDGVNDAPALKKADIGIAMGIRGTEAAKEAADMILNDDAFTSIVTAIKYGRVIFDNIRAFVIYLLSCNLSEILIVAVAAFADMPMPLLPLQILFLNMITDVFPALAIGMSKGEEEVVMNRLPKKSTEPIVSKSNWVSIVSYAVCLTAGVIGAEIYVLSLPGVTPAAVNNVTFYTLILAQLWNVFNMSPREVSLLNNQITRNRYIWYALIFCIAVTILMNFIPSLRSALSLVDFNTNVLAVIIAGSMLPVVLVQILKRVLKIIR